VEKKTSVVALVPCADYNEGSVYQAVAQGISLLGGIEKFISKEEKILLKPNLLGKADPEKAVTTHPAVFKAVGRLLRDCGYSHITYGDSPGVGSISASKVAEGCGISQPAQALDIPLADFMHGVRTQAPDGKISKHFMIAGGVLEADAIINICKMKTHALERVTGAVKNLYGCVQGLNKGAGHAKYPDAIRFARMLADLNKLLKPRLHIMDGIVAMEGNGPASGTPVKMKVLLFSADPVALDSVFCRLVNLSPAMLPTNVAGEQAGIGIWREEDIEILTPEGKITFQKAAELYGKADFQVFRGSSAKGYAQRLSRLIPALRERPVADPELCIRCGACVKSCPVDGKAVFLDPKQDKAPRYDYKKCIRCYCYQEMCPAKAITVWRPMKKKENAGKA
jgi:uncharacterized protein (DUF362 family)/Pyruvate/2-oxoacid:ferredoxin oxidoreductase delta subunit